MTRVPAEIRLQTASEPLHQWVARLLGRLRPEEKALLMTLWWCLWFAPNEFIFQKRCRTQAQVLEHVAGHDAEYRKINVAMPRAQQPDDYGKWVGGN